LKGLFSLFKRQPRQAQVPAVLATVPAAPNFSSYQWFGVTEGDDLQQGDIVENCRVYVPVQDQSGEQDELKLEWGERDLIVLSQSCDLVKGQKNLDEVILCELWRISEYKPPNPFSKKEGLEAVRKGQRPRFHMIGKSEIAGFEREIRIVDLQQIHSMPMSLLRSRASKEKHLRLLPPYREHLSQSFARVFMRVGLPIDIPPFVK
jgi:hypothetical protein